MDILIIVGQLVLSLSILIVLHEFGHFIPARLFKTRVEKFYLFFDPYFALFKKKIGETEWGIGWLPLGGYVKISGMIDESMDKEQLKQPPQPWEFRSKPAWQRLIIMLGGVTVNFLLGFLIYGLVLYAYGETYLPVENAKYGIYADSFANDLGFQTGDQLVSIDNEKVDNFSRIRLHIFQNESKSAQVIRDGASLNIEIPEEKTGKLASYKGDFILPRFPFKVAQAIDDFPAKKAGIKDGDLILALNGTSTAFYDEFAVKIREHKNEEVTVTVLRGTDTLDFNITTTEEGTVGVVPAALSDFFELEQKEYSLGEAMPEGVNKSVEFLAIQVNAFGQMFRGKVKASESLGGFGTIASMFGTTWDWQRFWRMTAIISLILAFMNLLPIPALDGGHVMFLLYEMISGRKPSDKFLEYATIAGFVLIIGLVLYANGLDIMRWLNGN